MEEAKKLFELECGRASLPTVFGLYMLFFVSAMMGKDRAGLMYRYMVCPLINLLQETCNRPCLRLYADQHKGTAHAEAVAVGQALR